MVPIEFVALYIVWNSVQNLRETQNLASAFANCCACWKNCKNFVRTDEQILKTDPPPPQFLSNFKKKMFYSKT
jgi:hypothetical protein